MICGFFDLRKFFNRRARVERGMPNAFAASLRDEPLIMAAMAF